MITKIIKAVMKANTEYTLIFNTREVTSSLNISIEISGQVIKEVSIDNNNRYKIDITVPSNVTDEYIYFNGLEHTKQIYNVMLLDRGIDVPYFKGIKSVGEVEGNKIELISNNANGSLSNKKEIQLNEPLRGVGYIKDKIIKINGKPYIKRECISVTYDGINNTMVRKWSQFDTENIVIFGASISNIIKNNQQIKCDKLKIMTLQDLENNPNSEFFTNQNGEKGEIGIGVLKTKLDSLDANGINKYLQSNPITVVIGLENPTYEPLETEPTLNTYNDTTHISNNSTIPCNMKIKNSGYNAIIKPSTQYTVALDTNKSGTVGLNLGGAKVTTTNNVATITTPSTLTDDSLRLYGKGIKASKVRLLEGYKTNWIPSHFEGMKSSFEDKLQEDGTFKMEILSNNENLFNNDFNKRFENGDYVKSSPYIYFPVNVNKNKNYTCYIEAKDLPLDAYCNIATRPYYDYPLFSSVFSGTTEPNLTVTRVVSRITLNNCNNKIYISLAFNKGNIQQVEEYLKSGKFKVIVVEQGNNLSFIPHKSNKVQFSSIEPLRSLPNGVKDKFVFKDGKLMIERNCIAKVINGSNNEYWGNIAINNKNIKYTHVKNITPSGIPNIKFICNRLSIPLGASQHYLFGINQIIINQSSAYSDYIYLSIPDFVENIEDFKAEVIKNPIEIIYQLAEPTYEEIPFELQKIILEGYENGTLLFDTNIPPTSTITYSGETPMVSNLKSNRQAINNNSTDINNSITPYMMDIDYRITKLNLAVGKEISDYKSTVNTFDMLSKDIKSNRLSKDEYLDRLDIYLKANKITLEEYEVLGGIL